MRANRFLTLALLAFSIFTTSLLAQTNQSVRNLDGLSQGSTADRLMQQGPDRAIVSVLTDDQRKSYRQALQAQREKLHDLETKMVEARKDLTTVSASGTFDENAVRTKAAYIGNIEVELAVVRARALSQVKPPLTVEQIEQMKNSAGGELPMRNRGGFPSVGGDLSVHPAQRTTQRDENDLPTATKP